MIWIKIGFTGVLFFMVLFIYSFFEKYWIRLRRFELSINKQAFYGYKIVFVSDFHHSPIVSRRFIKRVVKMINNLNPDIVLLGGDYISSKEKYITPVFNELSKLLTKDGVFGVIGNHDIDVSKTKILQEMKKANINSLNNLSYWIYKGNERIKVGGVADLLYDFPDVNKTIHDVNVNDYVILVSHNPDYVEEIKTKKVDLMLSGHTHGGQVTFFGLFAPYIPSSYKQKYRSGLKIINQIKIIISNGIGVVGMPIRFFARPEIVLIELNKE